MRFSCCWMVYAKNWQILLDDGFHVVHVSIVHDSSLYLGTRYSRMDTMGGSGAFWIWIGGSLDEHASCSDRECR